MNENDENTDEIDRLLSELFEPRDALPPPQLDLDAFGMQAGSRTPPHARDNKGSGGKGGK